LPFELRRWLALGVVVFFVSGATGFDPSANVGMVDVPTPPGPSPGPGGPGYVVDLPAGFALASVTFLVLAAGAVLLALVLALVDAVLEFVFVRAAASREVRAREYFDENTRKGLSVFLFRRFVGLVALAGVIFLAAFVFVAGLAGLVVVALLPPFVVLALLALYLLHRFTVDSVVPIMLVDDVGVVEGRLFVPEIRDETGEYAVYVLVRIGLGFTASVVAGVGFALVGLVVGVPFAAVGGVLLLLESAVGFGISTPLVVGAARSMPP
jgi:hypothetical protein